MIIQLSALNIFVSFSLKMTTERQTGILYYRVVPDYQIDQEECFLREELMNMQEEKELKMFYNA